MDRKSDAIKKPGFFRKLLPLITFGLFAQEQFPHIDVPGSSYKEKEKRAPLDHKHKVIRRRRKRLENQARNRQHKFRKCFS